MQFYYLNSKSEQAGPISAEELKNAGIRADTLVWKEGMKEWQAAGTVPELQFLFAAKTPPPPPPPAARPTPPPVPATPAPNIAQTASQPASATTGGFDFKKLAIAGGAVVILAVLAYFVFFRDSDDKTAIAETLNIDSLTKDEEDSSDNAVTPTKDTVKLIDLDTMANRMKWDTGTTRDVTSDTANTNMNFLPGFGAQTQKKETAKPGKKPAPKKTTRQESGQKPGNETAEEIVEEPRSQIETRVNPASYLTVIGTFRKNLIFEGVLEGTITSRYQAQLRNIVIEAWFLDASGQSIGTKRFTQHGPLPASSSITFRFKTNPPKGAKSVRYEIVSASTN